MKKRLFAVISALIMILSLMPVWETASAANCPPHDWGNWIITENPTCTTTGSKYRVCKRCSIGIEDRSIPALGHDWQFYKVSSEGTCIKKAVNIEKCSRCKKTRKVDGDYGSHKWGEWHESEGRTGVRERVCSVCKEKQVSHYPVLEGSLRETSDPLHDFFYTEGEKLIITASAKNKGEGDANGCYFEMDDMTVSLGTLGFLATGNGIFEYVITKEDVEEGTVSKTVFLHCNEKKPVSIGTVTVKTGKAAKEMSTSASIKVASSPETVVPKVGTEVRVDYRITNTGDTVIITGALGATDMNGKAAPFTYNDVPDMLPYQLPGEPAIMSVTYTVTQEDIDAGALIRDAHAAYSCVVSHEDGHVLTPEEVRKIPSISGDKSYLTGDIRIEIPLSEPGHSAGIKVYTAPEIAAPKVGEKVLVRYLIGNTGDTVIITSALGATDVNGKAASFTYNDVPDMLPYQEPCEAVTMSVTYTVTQDDIDAKVLIRDAHAVYSCIVSYEDGHVLTPEEVGKIPSISGDKSYLTNTVRLEVPLGKALISAVIEEDPGNKYVPAGIGGEIRVDYRITNTGNSVICLNGITTKDEKGWTAPVTFNEVPDNLFVLLPDDHSIMSVNYTVTQDDIDAGYLIRDAWAWFVCFISYEDGHVMTVEEVLSTDCSTGDDAYATNTVRVKIPLDTVVDSAVLEVASAPASIPATAGAGVRVDYRVTNTGNTVITATGLGAVDGKDKYSPVTFNELPEEYLPYQYPGDPSILSVNYTVTQDDIDAGCLIRDAHAIFNSAVSAEDGHMLTATEFGNIPSVDGTQNTPTNSVKIDIPISGVVTSIKAELVSAPANMPAGEGDTADMTYRITNTGGSVVSIQNDFLVKDGDGKSCSCKLVSWDTKAYFLFPGKSCEITLAHAQTANDIAKGEMIRDVTFFGKYMVSIETGEVATPENISEIAVKDAEDTASTNPVEAVVTLDEAGSGLLLELISFTGAETLKEGDEINGTLRVTNTGAVHLNIPAGAIMTAGDDILSTDHFHAFPGKAKDLGPNENCEITFCVSVTADDIAACEVYRRFRMIGNVLPDEEIFIPSNFVEGTIPLKPSENSLLLELVSFGAEEINENEFIPGTVRVTNTGKNTMNIQAGFIRGKDGNVMPKDYFHWFPAEASHLEPGNSCNIVFYVLPTAGDMTDKKVLRTVELTGVPAEGDSSDHVYSNRVTAELTLPEETPLTYKLTLIKQEVSSPGEKGYYEQGEEVSYLITVTNTGTGEVTGVTVYDSLKQENMGIIGTAVSLKPDESVKFPYTHKVDSFAAEQGFLDNYARAEYTGDDFGMDISNTVRVDTDGLPDDPVAPVIAPIKPNRPPQDPDDPDNPDHPDNPEDPGDPGTKTGRGCYADYRNGAPALTYCTEHQKTDSAAKAVSGDPAAVRALWQQALDEEYEEYLSRCNGPAMIVVQAERDAFRALIEYRERALRKIWPDNPSRVDGIISSMLREKVVVMCYELHTAPEARTGFSPDVTGDRLPALLEDLSGIYAGMETAADASRYARWLNARNALAKLLWPKDDTMVQKILEQDVLSNIRWIGYLK